MIYMSTKRGKLPPPPWNSPPLRTIPGATQLPSSCTFQLTPEAEYAVKVQNNPAILAEDASNYQDQHYVRTLADLFLVIAKSTEIPLFELKKFRISNMELALSKLAKEYPSEYKELCKYWGVVPEEHRSKKNTKGINPHSHLARLVRWGYFDLFFPNMDGVIDLVIKKVHTSSTSMTKIEKAKYAQIFAMFITGHSFMPYDLDKFLVVKKEFEKHGKLYNQYDLKESVLASLISVEKKACWNAAILYHFYKRYMSELSDGSINLDAVMYFMDLIDYNHKLMIKEFMDLLSAEMCDGCSEKSDFNYRHLSPIMSNFDIRMLKEQIFPFGIWGSNVTLFMMDIPEKERIAYRYAYNRFEKNDFDFGKGVETVKEPRSCKHACSHKTYTMYGYRYAWAPLAVRISDPNELWMMRMM